MKLVRKGKVVCRQPIGYFIDSLSGEIFDAYCKTWGCPECGPKKRGKLLDDVRYGSKLLRVSGYRWRFVSLSTGPDVDARMLPKYWARYRASIAKYGYRFQFFKVTEFQENGTRHYHAIINMFVPWGLLKHLWILATDGLGQHVDIRKEQLRSPAGYMLKYMGKGFLDDRFMDHERRYSFSQRFPRLPRPDPNPRFRFVYKPNNRRFNTDGVDELRELAEKRRQIIEMFGKRKKRPRRAKLKPRKKYARLKVHYYV